MHKKICGMTRQDNLDYAAALGFDFCGFIFHPRSPRYIDAQRVRFLQSWHMRRVGVFCDANARQIAEVMERGRLDFAQLHGAQTREEAMELGAERVIRVIWPMRYTRPEHMQEALDYHAKACAFFLVDAGKEGGGSGRTLDWQKLAGLRWPRPWFLAGGIDPQCIGKALGECVPDGIDINSGVEKAPGEKDPEKMRMLVHTLIREAR